MMRRAIFFYGIVTGIFIIGVTLFTWNVPPGFSPSKTSPSENQLSAASVSLNATSSEAETVSSSHATTTAVLPAATPKKSSSKAIISVSATTSGQIVRIQNPYSTPPEAFDKINTAARSALVNILCQPSGTSSLNPISGSGVIIDPRGIILTNAHVAQYVLLSESPQVDLSCVIRTGSPATAQWSAAVMYIPPVWVENHENEILEPHPTGTGEHDYAFLYITGSVTSMPLPSQFPYLPVDTRLGIGFPGDQVLVASYPAELIGGIAAEYDLYADTSITTIKQLLTFGSGTPDVLSLGGIIEAQSGSSGGAIVNAWGNLIALIATTSSGTTTANRDLRGVALSYIDTDLAAQSGLDLNTLLQGNPASETAEFTSSKAPGLIQLYVDQLSNAPKQ